MSRLAWAALGVALSVHAVGAQERVLLRGTVRDVTSGLAVAGAVVSLLDSARVVLERTTSGPDGTYRLPRATGAAQLQARRIGFRPYELSLRRDVGADGVIDFRMQRLPSLIAGVVTRANAWCPKRDDAPIAFGLWEEARSALLATVVARETQRPSVRRYRYNHVIEGRRVAQMAVQTDTSKSADASFSAVLTPQGFVRSGFAADDHDGRVYYGPDADVLLSDEFLAGYCLRVADRDAVHPERVGVRFTPARRANDRVEIDGTLWIDTVARTLTHIGYRYLVSDQLLMASNPGGEVIFAEMPNGSVLIDRWTMRLVGFAPETLPGLMMGNRSGAPMRRSVRLVRVINETGGALAQATWTDIASWRGTFGTLALHVRADSGLPLDGRWIQFPRTPYRAKLDESGKAYFDELIAGPYDVSLEDDRLSSIGLTLTVPLRRHIVRGETQVDSLRVPTPESFVLGRCRDDSRLRVGALPTLLMRVLTADGQPVNNARIDIAWDTLVPRSYTPPTRLYTTGTDGLATLCAPRRVAGKQVKLTVWMRGTLVLESEFTLADGLRVVPLMIRDDGETLTDSAWRQRRFVDIAVRRR